MTSIPLQTSRHLTYGWHVDESSTSFSVRHWIDCFCSDQPFLIFKPFQNAETEKRTIPLQHVHYLLPLPTFIPLRKEEGMPGVCRPLKEVFKTGSITQREAG